jgi:cytidine deaminase
MIKSAINQFLKMKKELTIHYEIFDDEKELSEEDKNLLRLAKSAMNKAYSPYSNFNVGTAVLLNNGNVQIGNNQENSSYSATICAERVALFAASAESDSPINKIAIVCSSDKQNDTSGPCGICRQVMYEYERRHNQKIKIILGGDKIMVFDGVENLMPFPFSF